MESAFGIDHGAFSKHYMEQRPASSKELAGERKKHPIKSKVFRRKYTYGTAYADDNGYRGVDAGVHSGDEPYGPTKQVKRFSSIVGGELNKSLVNGEFKAASALTRGERSMMGGYKQARGVTPEHQAFKQKYKTDVLGAVKANQEAGNGLKNGKLRINPFAQAAGTIRTGSKSSGQGHIFGAAPNEHAGKYLLSHEAQHADVKRSAYRLHHQIQGSPEKMFREEGRADYRAGGHYKNHGDEGSQYAQGARAIDGLDHHGPDSHFKFHPETEQKFKAAGVDTPKVRSRDAVDSVKTAIKTTFPHYPMEGDSGDRALRAYRDLHNSMKAKGVPEGKNRRVI